MPLDRQVLADLEVVHSQFGLAVFEQPLNRPAAEGYQQQRFDRSRLGGVAQEELDFVGPEPVAGDQLRAGHGPDGGGRGDAPRDAAHHGAQGLPRAVWARLAEVALEGFAPDLTLVLDRLQQRGLLRRQRNPADGRSQHIVLSDSGLVLAQDAARVATTMERELDARLTRAEHAMLIELLGKVAGQRSPA